MWTSEWDKFVIFVSYFFVPEQDNNRYLLKLAVSTLAKVKVVEKCDVRQPEAKKKNDNNKQ